MANRKPSTIVMYIELEDNVGYVLGKKRVEIPLKGDEIPGDVSDAEIAAKFNTFVENLQRHLEE